MSISWGTIKSLLLTLGPFLLPKAISWYRSARAASARADRPPVIPLPAPALRSIALLLLASALLLARALAPSLAPENVFAATQSRLQIPTDVLFTRLASLRPLGAADEALRRRFASLESRLLYLQYGPDVLAQCPFCGGPGDAGGSAYFYYALPALLAPHLANLFVASIATTPGLLGGGGSSSSSNNNNNNNNNNNAAQQKPSSSQEGRRWRPLAAMVSVGLALLDAYLTQSYNASGNARATRLGEVDMFFWRTRAGRHLALAGLDAALAGLLYLSSTRRALLRPPLPADRAAGVARRLLAARARLGAAGVARNAVLRDAELRGRLVEYWAREAECVREAREEDRDVVEGVKDALTHRIRIQDIEREAARYVMGMLPPLEDEDGAEGSRGGSGEGKGAEGEAAAVRETVVG